MKNNKYLISDLLKYVEKLGYIVDGASKCIVGLQNIIQDLMNEDEDE